MIAGQYGEAREQFDKAAARGGWTGRRARYYGAVSTLFDDDAEAAQTRFDAIVRAGSSYRTEARYWRARALDALDQPEPADADRAWILGEDPLSWYAVQLQQASELPGIAPYARSGHWPGPPPALPPIAPAPTPTAEVPTVTSAFFGATRAPDLVASGFAALGWPFATPEAERSVPDTVVRLDAVTPPPSYRPGVYFAPDDARETALEAMAGAEGWPELQTAYDLSRVGLYDFSGPLLSATYEEWREAWRSSAHPRHTDARRANLRTEEWRALFLLTRDHHHASRFTYGLAGDSPDLALQQESMRLAHPLAHARYVWGHAREHDIDPLLVMGIMRTESLYDATAVSRAGARGAMQIMPRTGHLLADLASDEDFTAGDLTDPVLSVGYGIRYLGLLMDRYEGVFPLAVASYNGGPHNVSAWLAGTGTDMPLDAFVEHIPFRETRTYVKRVTAAYGTYLSLYGDDGAALVPPDTPRANHPEIVDF